MLEQTALRIGLLASPPPAEQMEALLDGLLTPDESMIRGPDGMEPLSWRREAEPDVLFLEAPTAGWSWPVNFKRKPIPCRLSFWWITMSRYWTATACP